MNEALVTFTVVLIAAFGSSLGLRYLAMRGHVEPTASQSVPFLGGGEPTTHAWSRFHVRYYPMTLLFVAFEMEMMFMYPWAVVYLQSGSRALIEMGMFLSILSAGIAYGWREGAFRWQ